MSNLTAWDEIKRIMTGDSTPGTVGYQLKLLLASKLFVALAPYLNGEDATAAFDGDAEVREALINSPLLAEIRTCL